MTIFWEHPLGDLIRASHNTTHSISCCDQNSTLFLYFLENRWNRFLFVWYYHYTFIYFCLYIILILWHNFTVISGNLQYIYLLFFVQIVKIWNWARSNQSQAVTLFGMVPYLTLWAWLGNSDFVSQTTPETSVAGLRNHPTSNLVPNKSVTRVGIPFVSSVTHTFSRPVDTVVSNVTAPSFLKRVWMLCNIGIVPILFVFGIV